MIQTSIFFCFVGRTQGENGNLSCGIKGKYLFMISGIFFVSGFLYISLRNELREREREREREH